MKISIYNVKGSAGKTPLAVNIALDFEFALGTNEPFHVLQNIIPDNRLLSVSPDEQFPDIPDDIDIVFDLAGSISSTSHSITSALSQSDVVIVPIYNEVKCLQAGMHTILEVSKFCKNIVVAATKLKKARKDVFTDDWTQSQDFQNINRLVQELAIEHLEKNLEVIPLKFSTAFDAIFEEEKSISQIMADNKLMNHAYAGTQEQLSLLYKSVNI